MKRQAIVFAVALLVIPALAALFAAAISEPEESPERARFMLECVADWQYAAETCESILDGEPPPPRPDGAVEPGC